MLQKITDFKRKGLRGKKKAMFQALITTMKNISAATDKVGISRMTHYRWLEEDPNYKAWCDEAVDRRIDFYETALDRLAKEGNATAVIFGLKTVGKDRGYVERQEHISQVELKGEIVTKARMFEAVDEMLKDDEPKHNSGNGEPKTPADTSN